VTPAYGFAVVGGGSDHAAATAKPAARGNPNWWIILAVSLALMALLVATSSGNGGGHSSPRAADSADRHSPGAQHGHGAPRTAPKTTATTSTTTTTSTTSKITTTTIRSSAVTSPPSSGSVLTGTSHSSTTPAVEPPVTTTTITTLPAQAEAQPPAPPADSTETQGYLDPPLQASNEFGFTGTGSMVVSVEWSGDIYLTMSVSCPSGGDDVGGTAGMEASLPDASGGCTATVTEPSSESAPLTYTITWGPAGG
jgi:hypothetical protein